MNDFVVNEVRDAVIATLLKDPENKVCFDCKSKNPKWSSSNIGVFLCYQCTSKHRSMGVHISFVRSLKMDRWKRKELKQMELGGNKNALEFYEENQMFKDGKVDHEAPSHSRYKMDLAAKAEAAVRKELQAEVANNMGAAATASDNNQSAAAAASSNMSGAINGLQSLSFDVPKQQNQSNTFAAQSNEPAPQATFQSMSVPVASTESKPSGAMQLGKKSTAMQNAPVGGGISFARKQNNGQVKALGAKKLDIDFGGDDFFNSFQPAQAVQEPEPLFNMMGGSNNGNKSKSNKLQELDNDPFKLGSGSSGSNASKVTSMDFGGSANAMSSQQAQDRLRELGNRKAISSADFQHDDTKSAEMQSRFAALSSSGATQISSDMMFGTEGQAAQRRQNSFQTQERIEQAQQKLNDIKDSGKELFNNLFSKLSQVGNPGQ